MPIATNESVDLYFESAGAGHTVAFVGDVGFGAWQWGWQHAAVAGPYVALVFDQRGTGRSERSTAPAALSSLVMDLRTVLAAHGARRVTLVGAGLGGQVALEAARESGRVERLVLLGTSPRGDGVDLSAVRASRTDESTLRTSMTDLLSASFRASHPDVVDRIVAWRSAEDADASAWAAMADVVRDYSASACYEVTQPTLVVHGTGDRVWPVESGRELADSLPRGRFVPVEDAGHLVGVEASRVVNDELIAFLPELS